MFEPAVCIGEADRPHRCRNGGVEPLPRAGLGFAPRRLHCRPTGFDRRPGRRGGRPIAPTGTAARERLLDANRFVRPQMVHHDASARAQRGAQHLPAIGAQDGRVSRAVDGQHRVQAMAPQGPQPGHTLPVVLGDAAKAPLPGGGAALKARPRQLDARCLHALHAPEVERRAPLAVVLARVLDARGIPRAGVERLFWRGRPRRCRTRHIVGTLTRTPVSAAPPGHNASSVAPGWAPRSRRMTAWAAAPRRGVWPPAGGLGAILPVVRCWRRPFSTHARLTPKVSAMVRWEPRRRSQARRSL